MPDTAVTFRGVTVDYGATKALRGVDFTLDAGRTVALLGRNGAGKSTTVDLMLGLRRPTTGTVTVLGGAPAAAVAAGRVGAVLQNGGLPADATVGDVLTLAKALHRNGSTVDELLALGGLTDLVRRRVDRLSGGQAQRVRFAVALAGRPELLFLDEPTVGLDVVGRKEFWAVVRGIADQGRTVLFATHHLEEVREHADRVLVLDQGRLVADGTPAQISAGAADRTVRCLLPAPDPARLLALDGVREVSVQGERVTLLCTDADLAVAALYREFGAVRGLEVTDAGLDAALIALTSGRS